MFGFRSYDKREGGRASTWIKWRGRRAARVAAGTTHERFPARTAHGSFQPERQLLHQIVGISHGLHGRRDLETLV